MKNNLPTGFTDNSVTQVDGLVVKTGKCTPGEYAWYSAYKDKADIPGIVGLQGNSIVMGYVERCGECKIDDVHALVTKYMNYPPLNNLGFSHYYNRIVTHLKNNPLITNGQRLLERLSILHIQPTFAHGDLSVYNIIPSSTGLKLIDPLYSSDTFGSFYLDYAKLLFSLKFYSAELEKFQELRIRFEGYMDILIASECVRVSTYKKQFSFIAENLINEL